MIRAYPLIRGLASYLLPGSLFRRPGTGGSNRADYCYSVWLRHLVLLHRNGLLQRMEQLQRVAEIGPGDSLGSGLAALYSGAASYTAMDLIPHAAVHTNLRVNDELLRLFLERAPIPEAGFPDLSPAVPGTAFPQEILKRSDAEYNRTHESIRRCLLATENADSPVRYIAPWPLHEPEESSFDLIFSQAAMEHVDDIARAYQLMYRWLRPGGMMSHQVDFRAHEMSRDWDGHFYIPPACWRILAHGRKYPMNRLPLSAHLRCLEAAGFRIAAIQPVTGKPSRPGSSIRVPETVFSDADRVTMGALIQAVKA